MIRSPTISFLQNFQCKNVIILLKRYRMQYIAISQWDYITINMMTGHYLALTHALRDISVCKVLKRNVLYSYYMLPKKLSEICMHLFSVRKDNSDREKEISRICTWLFFSEKVTGEFNLNWNKIWIYTLMHIVVQHC